MLSLFDTKRILECLVDSMCHPGKVNNCRGAVYGRLGGRSDKAMIIAAAEALLIEGSTFALDRSLAKLGPAISRYTGAVMSDTDNAEFIFAEGDGALAEIAMGFDISAAVLNEWVTVILAVNAIAGERSAGSGVEIGVGSESDGQRVLSIEGLLPENLNTIKELNGRFAKGLDVVLVSRHCEVAVIPGFAAVEILHEGVAENAPGRIYVSDTSACERFDGCFAQSQSCFKRRGLSSDMGMGVRKEVHSGCWKSSS